MKFDGLLDAAGGNTETPNENVAIVCPNCGEKKLYVHRSRGMGICFRCNYRAGALRLVKDLYGLPTDEDAYIRLMLLQRGQNVRTVLELQKSDDARAGLLALLIGEESISVEQEAPNIQLPTGLVSIERRDGHSGFQYLMQRGFNDIRMLRPFSPMLCQNPEDEDARLENHIIFQDFNPDTTKLRYWTSRAAFEPRTGPKSYHPSGVKHNEFLFGESAVKDREYAILVEGPLDAIALRGRGVALLGKILSIQQAMRAINRYNRLILLLDSDAGKAATDAMELLLKLGANAYVSGIAPYKDAAECLKAYNGHWSDVLRVVNERAEPLRQANVLRSKLGAT